MWLEQKKFIFGFSSKGILRNDNFEEIYVRLNEKQTTIKLSQLFVKISKFEFEDEKLIVKGWSILEKIDNLGQILIIDQLVKFDFIFEEENILNIISVETPWFQLNDIEIDKEAIKAFDEKLLELSGVVNASEDNTGEDGSPQSSPPVIVNSIYESVKPTWLKRGFKEYIFENFRLLIKNDEEYNSANLVELINEERLIQLKDPKKVIDNFYKFEDLKNQRIVNAKIIDDVLDISFSEISIVENENSELEKENVDKDTNDA